MPVEQQEGTLEVVNLPPSFDTELLELYFSNKRRSGGGPLVSVEKRGDRVILVFEETEGELGLTAASTRWPTFGFTSVQQGLATVQGVMVTSQITVREKCVNGSLMNPCQRCHYSTVARG